ncbi:MAG TPA: efflux RND transporter periplasmic adaptor subunit [Deltaproteobacteria bacterium]|nr:efflux RND transporter periplasmic adaptor subunit [Deltaproteobacteria bacterium]HQB38398.1 efflux RND transporter periplasmic adaptor subunit [Deltaproteobacteria bacterium]
MQTRIRYRLLMAAGTLATICALGACGKPSKGGAPQGGAPEVSVVVIKPEKARLTTELPGRTSAFQISEVRPQVGGIIQKRLFTEGADVKAGDALYQIDPASYKAAHASAKANLAKAEASLLPARLKAGRYQELIKIKAVSQQEADETAAALKQAEAEVEAAKAALETARINLGYTRIIAPISGRIGKSTVTNGALVTASQATALTTIQQLDPVYVDVTQSSSEMLQLKRSIESGVFRKGTKTQASVKLLLEDGSAYPVEGTLKFSDITVEQSTGSVTLRSIFPNPKKLLLPGMFVRAVLEEGVNDQAILVPQRGVTRNPSGNAMVLVVGAEDKVEIRPIKVVRTVGDKWLVSEGLKEGDRVIVEGLQKARPGTPVKTVLFGAKPAQQETRKQKTKPDAASKEKK